MGRLRRSRGRLSLENSCCRLGCAGPKLRSTHELAAETYQQLVRIAARIFRQENTGHILEPVAVVNEAVMRMLRKEPNPWRNRSPFVGVAAHMMRQVLIDYARWRNADKRYG